MEGATVSGALIACGELAIAGYFLFGGVSDPDQCNVLDFSSELIADSKHKSEVVDVAKEFILIWKVIFVTAFVKIKLMLLLLLFKRNKYLLAGLNLSSLIASAAWLNGIYTRISHNGRVCSGDFLDEEQRQTQKYLRETG